MKNHKFGLGVITGILIAVLVIGSVGVGYFYSAGANTKRDSRIIKKVNLLEKYIDEFYMGDISKKDEEEGIYAGLVKGLNDPYSEYFSPKEYAKKQEENSGQYAGIGALVAQDKKTGYSKITGVYEGSPAEKSGVKKNDLIVEVNGKSVDSWTVDQVVSKVRGKVGTVVQIKVFRPSIGKYKVISITRDHVDVTSVASAIVDKKYNIGYIRISEFKETTYKQFKKNIQKLKKKKVKGIIYDVRSNPGGSLQSICQVLDDLVPKGNIITVKNKNGREQSITSDAREINIPGVVLVDGNTASAAELFTGAMQDYKKAVVVGETTYGKGVVQNTYELEGGAAIKLTIEKYFTPKGRDINKKGIKPDIVVSNTQTEDLQYKKGLEIMKKTINPKAFKAEKKNTKNNKVKDNKVKEKKVKNKKR